MFVQGELWFAWSRVSIFDEQLVYVYIHGYAAGSLGVLFSVITFKVDPCEFIPFPVGCYLVVMLQGFEEM